MSETVQLTQTGESAEASPKSTLGKTLRRLGTYTGVRIVTLFITVIIGVYLTILIANMGGYVDRIRSGQIREQIGLQILADPELRKLPANERNAIIAQRVALEEQRMGLDRPFIIRSFDFLKEALTLIQEEGLENRVARHQRVGDLLKSGLTDLGLELFGDPDNRLPMLTCVMIPDGVDDATVRGRLLKEYGIEIVGGFGPLKGKAWRIGLMGYSASVRNVHYLLAALSQILGG